MCPFKATAFCRTVALRKVCTLSSAATIQLQLWDQKSNWQNLWKY